MAGTRGSKGRSKGTSTKAPAVESAPLNIPSNLSGGGVLSTTTPSPPSIPPSFFASTLSELEADVSGELEEATFGDVLLSVGTGIAESQESLDAGLVETARMLSDTTITVVTDVIQELDENGLPDPAQTDLISHDVSLINYINPTVHEWKHMALSMDLNVGALDLDKGVVFTRNQSSTTTNEFGIGGAGLLSLFGRISATSRTNSTSEYESESQYERQTEFSQGQVRMDALLGPRRTGKFPVPAEVTKGPQIFFSQGATSEAVNESGEVTERKVDMVISVLKQNGEVNPNVNLLVEADGLGFSFVDDGTYNGSKTNSDGEIKISIVRPIFNARYGRSRGWRVTARLGQVERKTQITL